MVEGKGEGIACRKVAKMPLKRMEQIVQERDQIKLEIRTVVERPRVKIIKVCCRTMQSTSVSLKKRDIRYS